MMRWIRPGLESANPHREDLLQGVGGQQPRAPGAQGRLIGFGQALLNPPGQRTEFIVFPMKNRTILNNKILIFSLKLKT